MDPELRVGIDLGGTKIEGVVVRLSRDAHGAGVAPRALARVRVATERDGGYDHVVARAAGVVQELLRQAGLAALPPTGVGMPGSVTRGEEPLVKNSNTTCLNGRPFRRDLAAAIGGTVAFANDANCFALAEATYGAARGARVAFGVILGTGVGGGVVFTKGGAPSAWDGAQGIAGEWGHVALEPTSGPPCYCGRRGCVEQYLSGPAIERAYRERSGVPRALREIEARRATDPFAAETLAEAGRIFGRALATVINVLDPDVVVLGGGVSNVTVFYEAGRTEVLRWVFNDELRTKIVRNELGDSAGVLGAALLRHAG